MKRTWTIIGVSDVAKSFAWYQSLLGLPQSAPSHDYFGQIVDSDGTVLLCLHAWGAHEHPSLTSPDRAEPGNGLLLFFRVDDFRHRIVARSRARQSPRGTTSHESEGSSHRGAGCDNRQGFFVVVPDTSLTANTGDIVYTSSIWGKPRCHGR